MKKSHVIIISIVAVILILLGWGISQNNSLVNLSENINQNQSEIDNQLKRRADLIPNLVSTVKGSTNAETKVIEDISNARAGMTSGTTDQKLAASDNLTKNINILIENYPNIKFSAAYTGLMDELSGTENRIAVARKNYNDVVASYNKKVRSFPINIVAKMLGYSQKTYLQIEESEKATPQVQF